jgi:predicted RNA-binding Zn-ribbon protein involved in translation (DUF1610 family)
MTPDSHRSIPNIELTVSFHCPDCGASTIRLPETFTENSPARCAACGLDLGLLRDLNMGTGKLMARMSRSEPARHFRQSDE